MSVLAARNSTPSSLASIMRLMALQPPPPTPMTFSFATVCGLSWYWIRISWEFLGSAIRLSAILEFQSAGLVKFTAKVSGGISRRNKVIRLDRAQSCGEPAPNLQHNPNSTTEDTEGTERKRHLWRSTAALIAICHSGGSEGFAGAGFRRCVTSGATTSLA